MITDSLVNFFPSGANIPILGAAVRSGIYDILGLGIGVASGPSPGANGVIIGNAATFGADMGIGGIKPLVECSVGTAFAGSGTLTVAFQGAQEAAGGVPGAWQTFIQSPACTIAQLTAQSFFARFDFPPEYPDGFNPRFLSLLFTPSATFTAGTVAYAQVTMGRPDLANKFAAANYKVAG